MNKKGFTLVELLAAITILALLAIITVPAVTKPVKESKQDLYVSQLRSFKDSAKAWGADNMYSNLPEKGTCILMTLNTLVKAGLVEPDVKNSLNGKKYISTDSDSSNGVFIKIKNEGTDSNKYTYSVYDCTNYDGDNSDACFNPDNQEDDANYYSLSSECRLYEE